MKSLLFCLLSMTFPLTLTTSASEQLKHFPAADEGMIRHVLHLPEVEEESDHQVELIVGKTALLDPNNRYFFGGTIEAKTVEGFGYTRYVVDEIGAMAGTLMAVNPDTPKAERFVSLGGAPYLIRYNSKLPIVVYVPEGVDVRYRIWHCNPEPKVMEKG